MSLLNRLLRNAEREAASHSDAAGHAAVARLHTLAVAGDAADLEPAELEQHLTAAITEYRRALAIEQRAIYFHGLGYAYEEAVRQSITTPGAPSLLREQAIEAYLAARSLAANEPKRFHPRPGFLDSIDAATELALSRIGALAADKERKPPKKGKQNQKETSDADKGKKPKKEKGKNKRPVPDDIDTPVVFGAADSVRDLLDPERTVSFDLAGDGRPRRWPWVRPTTGILVWDPTHSGQITSGRQLFGSVTWWIFWSDGYRALAALDDDGDGWLAGSELDGIGVWYDRNSNGVSDPGEVVSHEKAGVQRIAVQARRGPDGVLTHQRGIVLRDQVLPSFDWLVVPLQE